MHIYSSVAIFTLRAVATSLQLGIEIDLRISNVKAGAWHLGKLNLNVAI